MDRLDHLYTLLDRIGLKASDVAHQIRREGKKIQSLADLSEFEIEKLIKEAEANLSKKASGPTLQ